MKLTTYSVGALAFAALSNAIPTRPRQTIQPYATITDSSNDNAVPTIYASTNETPEEETMPANLDTIRLPLSAVDAHAYPIVAVIPRGHRHKAHKKPETITPTTTELTTTTVTFGTTEFASEQTDSWGDLTGEKRTTYYLKFTDELPWTSTKTITHTYTHITPIEGTRLEARIPRTTTPISTQPDIGDHETFEFITFSKTSWITSTNTLVEIIRWPPKTRGEWPHFSHFHESTSTNSAAPTGKHGHSGATKRASPTPSKNTKSAKRTKHHKIHKNTPSSTAAATSSTSSYVDSFEWSKTHVFEPENTEARVKRAIQPDEPTSVLSSLIETPEPTVSSYVDSFEWSKTHTYEPETSVTVNSTTIIKRAMHSYEHSSVLPSPTETPKPTTSSYVDCFEWSKTHTDESETGVTPNPTTMVKRDDTDKSTEKPHKGSVYMLFSAFVKLTTVIANSVQVLSFLTGPPEISVADTLALAERAIHSKVRESTTPSSPAILATPSYVDSFEWSKTHTFEPEPSSSEPPTTLITRAMLPTRPAYDY